MTFEQLLSFHRHGHLTDREFFIDVAQLITADNVGNLITKLPEENRGQFLRWITNSGPNPFVFGSNLYPAEAERLSKKIGEAVAIVRNWQQTQNSIGFVPAATFPELSKTP